FANGFYLKVCIRHVNRHVGYYNVPIGIVWYVDGTGRNGEGTKMLSDGNKEEEEGDGEVVILCSKYVEQVVPGGEEERKFTQNSSRGIACSTHFRRTKRGTERLVPLRFIPAHVPNGTIVHEYIFCGCMGLGYFLAYPNQIKISNLISNRWATSKGSQTPSP
ncbi:hypothetical protein DVH24_010628, partial [Malus domestica]